MKRRLSTAILALSLTTAAAGCYGSNGAFNAIHDWNGQVTGDKWANSAVHFALWIVPVYELALLGDILIFNTIEHFTGSNPFGK